MLDSIFGANPDIKRVQSQCARILFGAGISANVATILAALAGTIARECAAPSALGGVLDLSADRVVEACVIVGIAWHDPALYFPALVLVAT
jgi:phosphatidylglycerophosphate synthase